MRTASHLLQLLFVFSSVASAHARDSAEVAPIASDGSLRVWCKDGSIFKGEIIELVPKSYVVLQLSGGRTMRIEWSKISRTQAAEEPDGVRTNVSQPAPVSTETKAAPPKSAPTPSPPPSPVAEVKVANVTTPSVSSLPLVTVRTTGMKSGGLIEYRAKTMEIDGPVWPVAIGNQTVEEWKPLCAVPCVAKIDPELPIRLRGPSIQPTGRIWIPSRAERYEMEISPGHSSIRTGAWFSFGFGIGFLVTGTMVLGIGKYDSGTASMPVNTLVPGAVTAGIGLAGLITSVPLFTKSATTVDFFRE